MASYQSSHTTDSKLSALNEYIASAPADFLFEFRKENSAYFGPFPNTGSVALPAYITALPSSLQGYVSLLEEEQASIIDAVANANSGVEPSAYTNRVHNKQHISGGTEQH